MAPFLRYLAQASIAAVLGAALYGGSGSDVGPRDPISVANERAYVSVAVPKRGLSAGEAAALETLVMLVPSSERARLRTVLTERIANGHTMRIRGNPEMQKHLEAIYEAQAQDARRAAALN